MPRGFDHRSPAAYCDGEPEVGSEMSAAKRGPSGWNLSHWTPWIRSAGMRSSTPPPACSPPPGLRTTLQEIAEASGIQPGSLYHHFESKEAIIVELVKRYHADLDRQAEMALKELRESDSRRHCRPDHDLQHCDRAVRGTPQRGSAVLVLRPSGKRRPRTGPTGGPGTHGDREGDAQDPRGRARRRFPPR